VLSAEAKLNGGWDSVDSENSRGEELLPGPLNEYVFSQPRCKVCASPYRSDIDLMLASGRKQADVLKHWNQVLRKEYFTANNISIHTRKHLAVHDQIARRLVPISASRGATAAQSAAGDRPKVRAATEAIVRGGLQAMDAGLTVPEPRDVLAAAKVLATIDAEDAAEKIAGMEREMKLFLKAVREIVPQEYGEKLYLRWQELLVPRASNAAG
jgi:hypothetical protein